jgi:hypothetical protein
MHFKFRLNPARRLAPGVRRRCGNIPERTVGSARMIRSRGRHGPLSCPGPGWAGAKPGPGLTVTPSRARRVTVSESIRTVTRVLQEQCKQFTYLALSGGCCKCLNTGAANLKPTTGITVTPSQASTAAADGCTGINVSSHAVNETLMPRPVPASRTSQPAGQLNADGVTYCRACLRLRGPGPRHSLQYVTFLIYVL